MENEERLKERLRELEFLDLQRCNDNLYYRNTNIADAYILGTSNEYYKKAITEIKKTIVDIELLNCNYTFKTKPYHHQLKVFNRFKDSDMFALFADMGTGKTKMAIDIAAYKYIKKEINAVLVIAPNHVHAQWLNDEFPKHCPINYAPFIWNSGKNGNKLYKKMLDEFLISDKPKLKVFTINVEAFQSKTILPIVAEYVKNHKPFIIIDESTRIKNSTALRSKMIHKLNKYGKRCILTGTPTAKSPFDLWSQFEFLKANYFQCNFMVFKHRYGVLMKGTNQISGRMYTTLIDEKTFYKIKSGLNKKTIERGGPLLPIDIEAFSIIFGVSEKNVRFIETQDSFKRFKRLDELKELIKPDTFSIKKSDCLDLPPKIYEVSYIDLTKEQRRVYNNLKTELLAEYDGKELSVINKVSLTLRLMQVCGGYFPYVEEKYGKEFVRNMPIGSVNPKLKRLREEIEELGEQQIIIWSVFVAELEAIRDELSKDYSTFLYYGKTLGSLRQKARKDFSENKFQLFIANPASASFGLNLQTATTQLWYSNDFKTENRLQGEDRNHRIGIDSSRLYKDIIAKNTIDEKIYKCIREGRDLNDYFKSNSLSKIFAEDT